MRYKSFRIKNFKGIKDTTVDLSGISGAGVFAFVGLNESGKTTVLEAIHSFSPDDATGELLGGDIETGVPIKNRVPRHLISNFTGDVSVTATLIASDEDVTTIIRNVESEHGILIDVASFPKELQIERQQRFKNGDYLGKFFTLRSSFSVKTKKQKTWRSITEKERIKIRDMVYSFTPNIAYFPTFVFDFPEKIFLT
jgi:hypothetical protein